MSKVTKKLYIGNLPPDVRTRDIEDLFYKYGKIADIDVKTGRGPPFAFVEFEDERDAEDAVRHRDGYNYDGYTIRVEFQRAARPTMRNDNYNGRNGSGHITRNRYGPPSRRSEFRVRISGIPSTGSWQDLKDHMREAGDVGYADVFKDGTGVVEFLRYEDMKYALKNLNDSKFKSHEGDVAYIRLREEKPTDGGRSRSRSVSPAPRTSARGGRLSPTYSPLHSRSRSRSR